MPLLVDGNNLMYAFAGKDRTRATVRRRTLELVRHERMSVTIVFDGPAPEGVPGREHLGRTTVVYAGADKADDVIVRSLPAGAAAREWTVVTDDQGLAGRVRRRGAQVRRLTEWLRKIVPSATSRKDDDSPLSADEIADWETYFSSNSSPL